MNKKISRAQADAAGSYEHCDTTLAVAAILALTAIRIVGLSFAHFELDFEEAQYWSWSQHFAFGYFSKPPLIAWIIHTAESVCGSGESCIRTPSALLYGATSLVMFAAIRRLYDPRTALWTSVLIALAPGVIFSARLITTDVPLLFCIALAIYAITRLRESADLRFGVLLGVALGLGILAKYAMVYVLGCVALLGMIAREERRWILSRAFLAALVIAALIVLPNVWWNIQNGFSTLAHTRENIEGEGTKFNPLKALEFFGAQFGLAGPIVFAAFVARMLGYGRTAHADSDRLLLTLSAPVVIVLTLYAFVVRANANWGASGVLPAIALGTAVLVATNRRTLLVTSLAIGVVVQTALFVGDIIPQRISLPFLKYPNPYARVLGWADLARQLDQQRRDTGSRAFVAEERRYVSLFTYYLRETGLPVLMWGHKHYPTNHFEATAALTKDAPGPLLFFTECEGTQRFETNYARVDTLPRVSVVIDGQVLRRFDLFRFAEPRGDIAPLRLCRPDLARRK